MTRSTTRARCPFFILPVSLLLFAFPCAVARGQTPIPAFDLPPWISITQSTTVKDTRATDGANAQVVCNVVANVQVAEPGRAPITLAASLVATWTPAQNQWAFAENLQAGAIPFFPGISLGTLRLVRPQATWCFTGTFSLDPFRQKAAPLAALPETLGFTVDASGFTAHLPVPASVTLGAGVTVSIAGVELLPDANTGQLGLGLDATLTWGTTLFNGLISWTGSDVVFTLEGRAPSNGVAIPNVCTLSFVSFQAHLAGTLNLTVTGHLTPATGTPAADLFGTGFDFTLIGPSDAYAITATFASNPPCLSLGGSASLTVISAALTRSPQGVFTWAGNTSLNLGGSAVTGTLDLSGSNIRIANVSLPGLPPGLSLGMTRVSPTGAPAVWSGSFDTSLQPADVSLLFAAVGFPSVSIPAARGISGVVSGNAMRFSFKDLPPLPVAAPWCMPLQPSSIREFNFTRETGGAGRAFLDVVLDFDLSGIPGLAGAPKVPVAILAGYGIAPATVGAPSNGATPWFGTILAGFGGNLAQRFNWYVPSGTPSSSAGLAFGPAGPTSIPGIPVSGVGTLAMGPFIGGYQNGVWNLGGSLTLSGLRSFQFMDFGLPTSLSMNFAYDGTTFTASYPASHLLNLAPGMTLTLGDYSLVRNFNDTTWAFGMDGAFSWMSAAPVGGHVDLAAAQVNFLPQASLLHFDLPGSFDPDLQNLKIGMTTPFTCAGDANISLPSGGPVASMLGGMKGVGLSFSAGPSGWLLSTLPKAALPTIEFSGGDTLSIQSMSLQVPKTGTNMVFSCAATLGLSGKAPISGTLTVSDTTFALDLQDAQIVQGLGVHASITLTKDPTGTTLFNGTIDGTVSQQDLASLYQRYGLTAASAPGGNITISGGLSNTVFDLDIENFPPPLIPGLTGVTFKDIDDLHIHVDRGQKKETLSVTTDLAIAGLIDNLRVALEVDVTPAPTSPDLSVSLILNATGRGPSVTLPDFGTIVFNGLTGGRKGGVWSVTGNLDYTPPSAWCAVKMGTFSVPSTLNLGLTLDPTGFAATFSVPPGTTSLDVLPGFPLDLKTYKFSVIGGKVAFGIVSGLNIPNAPSVGGGIDFAASGIAFTIEPGVSISLPICDITKKKVAALAISNLTLSLADLSLGGDVTLTLSGDPKKDFLLKVLGTNTFQAVLQGSPSAFSVKIIDLNVHTTLSLGKLGTATLAVSFLQFGSDGTVGGTGQIGINNQSLILSIGMQAGCPYVGFTPQPSIDINVNNIFDFRLTNEIRVGTNLAGFATMTVQGVHLTVGPASNPAGEVDAVNFVYYLPDPEFYFPGMVFFDSFTGYVNVAGFKANLTVELPDPLSAANAQAVLQNLFAMLSGNWKPSDFDKLTAPAFGLHNVYIQFPTVPGLVWDDGQKAFVQTNDLFAALFKTDQKNFVLVSDYSLKLSTMLESCGLVDEKQMGITLLNAINGTRQLKLLGLDATSTINLGANGLHSVFDLSLNIPGPDAAHSVIQTSGHYEGDIGSDGSFDFEDDGTLKVKVGSTWYTVEQTHLIISSKTGFSFRGSILGAVGTGTLKPNGEFNFTGTLNTKGNGESGIVATFTANNQELKITGKSYVNGMEIWNDRMTLENGNLTFDFSGKGSDYEYNVKVTFGLAHPSFTFTGSASGTYDVLGVNVTAKSGEITFHIDAHTISTDLYVDGVKAKTFAYNFQTHAVTIK